MRDHLKPCTWLYRLQNYVICNYLQKDKQRDQPDHSCRRRHCHWNVTSLFIHLVTSCRDRTPRQLKPL